MQRYMPILLILVACSGQPTDAEQEEIPTPITAVCGIDLTYEPATSSERSTFDYDVGQPLELETTLESESNGIRVNRISFASGRGGRTTGYLLVPSGVGRFAGVVVQHGLPGSAAGVLGDARLFAEHGAVVIAIDAYWNSRGGAQIHFTPQDSAEQVRLIVDIRRALDILRQRVDIDPNRIAYRGWSYGAAMGALAAGVEPRFKTLILTVADGGLVNHMTGPEDRNSAFDNLACNYKRAWIDAMLPIEPIRFIGLATAPLLLQSGRFDTLVPTADAERLHRFAPASSRVIWYQAGHGLNGQAIADQLAWLHEHVGMRN